MRPELYLKCARSRMSVPLYLVVLLAFLPQAMAVDQKSLGLSVKKLLWAGSGCNATVDGGSTVLDDGKTISLPLPLFAAKPAPTGGSLREMRKNCSVSMEMEYAKDLEFRVIAAEIEIGSKGKELEGLIRTDLRFQGDSTANFQDYEVKGAKEASRVEIKLGQTTWSKCGGRKPFKVQLAARLNKSLGKMEAGETELTVRGPLNLKLEWRVCKAK